uniref:ornithine decarboxylase n=1 Tax=Parastrongyloides trichosuri TaxID=131310 RepID=A0A0N4Z4Q2_PARTI
MLDIAGKNVIFEVLTDKKIAVFNEEVDNLKIAQQIAVSKRIHDDDEPFIVMNLDTVIKKYTEFKKLLPRVKPFYAVKCNNDPILLKTLSLLGTGFDCASKGEIEDVIGADLATPDNIIYANPCKTKNFIRHAQESGIKMMTFDHEEELLKIASIHKTAELIIRIAVSDPTAQCPLNLKFGCDPINEARHLIEKAFTLGVKVIGVSFHVGSGCNDPTAFKLAIQYARDLFDFGEKVGHKMTVLDIGGGFPGHDKAKTSFETIAGVIAPELDESFPEECGVRIIAEPGRYFAASPSSVTANVIAKSKVVASRITKNVDDSDKDGFMYYINDGVYGSFNCILFDHEHCFGHPLFEREEEPTFPTTIWGPTCDSLDQVEALTYMRELQEGDWIHYSAMGAYTTAAASTFNGFAKPKVYYVMSESAWEFLNKAY